MIEQSHGFCVHRDETEDFIANPKPSGYRSIHLMADFSYDSVTGNDGHSELTPRTMVSVPRGAITHCGKRHYP